MKFRSLLLLAVLIAAVAHAAPKPKAPPPKVLQIEPKDGETFVFLGDSITHQGLYTQYLEDFFYTRYPALHLHFRNAGVGGDTVKEALERFDDDVAAFKPAYVFVLLGMNDGHFTELQPPAFEAYQAGLSALLDRIAGLGAAAIPITPPMYDSLPARLNQRWQEPRDKVYNDVMGTYAAWLKAQAAQRKLPVIDLHTLFNKFATDLRKVDADWIISPDGMHPQQIGHVLIASAILNEVVAAPPIAEIVLTKKEGKWSGDGGSGTLADVQGDTGVAFTFTAKALPWVLPPEAAEGVKLAQSGGLLNRERLTVRGLAPASYKLKIDGAAVGRWSETELAAGVDLGENPATPQWQQALEVAKLNKQRNISGVHPLRYLWAQYKGQRAELAAAELDKAKPDALEKATKAMEKFRETMKASIEDYATKSQDYEEQIDQARQPLARKYELSPK